MQMFFCENFFIFKNNESAYVMFTCFCLQNFVSAKMGKVQYVYKLKYNFKNLALSNQSLPNLVFQYLNNEYILFSISFTLQAQTVQCRKNIFGGLCSIYTLRHLERFNNCTHEYLFSLKEIRCIYA